MKKGRESRDRARAEAQPGHGVREDGGERSQDSRALAQPTREHLNRKWITRKQPPRIPMAAMGPGCRPPYKCRVFPPGP